jgi:two-component system, sensor histidine kinase and response regulator
MKKVLVIDDSADIRNIIAESLNLYGFSTAVAADGESGITLAREAIPDLVICDINMPNVDGYATLSALREDDRTATIPFIFLTGATDKLNMRKGMEMGADDYLTKPFTHKELLAAVNARLEKQAEQKRQSEKKLNELRGNITLALPHELRTPLNGILGLAGLLIDDYETVSKEELLESAKHIQESALRLHHLIENFLVYSQIELMSSDSIRIDSQSSFRPVPVCEIVPDLAAKVAAQHRREGDLEIEVSDDQILVPSENLAKIVEELVDNAFKFSDPGQLVRVVGQSDERTFSLTITDEGRGMTPENIANIGPHMQFERQKYEQQGSGLGLIIAKKLTELLGGQFGITSQLGKGCSVRVSFGMPGR